MTGQVTRYVEELKAELTELRRQLDYARLRQGILESNVAFYQAHYNRKLVITHDYGRCVPAKDLKGKDIIDLLVGLSIVDAFTLLKEET